jgi:hypothetical protein
LQRFICPETQVITKEQILGRIASQGQFWKDDDLRAFHLLGATHAEYSVGIANDVANYRIDLRHADFHAELLQKKSASQNPGAKGTVFRRE